MLEDKDLDIISIATPGYWHGLMTVNACQAGKDVYVVDCVISRKRENLIAEIESGHMSTAMMHLGNIAYRTGRKLEFDTNTEKFIGDKEANTYLSRPEGGRKPFTMPK